MAGDAEKLKPLSAARIGIAIDDVCLEFEEAWKRGEAPVIEDFIEGVPQAVAHGLVPELVALEVELQGDGGPEPDIAAYMKRFPDHADNVRAVLTGGSHTVVTQFDTAGDVEKFVDTMEVNAGPRQLRCPNCQTVFKSELESSTESIRCTKCGRPIRLDEAQDAVVQQTLLRFELLEEVGHGSFGTVWKARDTELDRTVAIKIPKHGNLKVNDARQFLRDARAAAQLRHPNIVAVHEVGQQNDTIYIVSDFIDGWTLSEWVQQNPPTVRDAARMCLKIALALHHAHEAGVIHRDLKPGNIMVDQAGEPHLIDFGMAKRASADESVTVEGRVMGTPAYMSPEQALGRGSQADRRTDVYSIGVIFFQMLTGERLFQGDMQEVMRQLVHEPAPDPRTLNADVPADLATVCLKCLEKGRSHRFETTADFADELQRWLDNRPVQIRPPGAFERCRRWCQRNPVVAGLSATVSLLVLVLAVVGWIAFTGGDDVDVSSPGTPSNGDPDALPPAASGASVKVGVLHSLSGTMAASESPVLEATLQAIEKINAQGGVLGRPIKPVVADGASDELQFLAAAERLISEEGVSTIFGCWTSASRKRVREVVEKHDHLLMYPVQYEGLELSPNIVYLGAAPNQQLLPAVRWSFDDRQHRRFFLIGSDYVFPRAANEIIKDELKSLGGEVAGEEYVRLGETDFHTAIALIKDARPDVILNAINGDSNVAFFRQLRAAGITASDIPTISFSIAENELRTMDIGDMAGDYAAWNYFQSIDNDINKHFVEELQSTNRIRVTTDPMESAWTGVHLWASAVQEAGDISPARIRRALLNASFDSPSGEVRVDPATQHLFKTARIGRIQSDGQFEIVWTSDTAEAPVPYPPSRTTAEWKQLLTDLYNEWGGNWSAQ